MPKFVVILFIAIGLAGLTPMSTAVAGDVSVAERVENLSAEGAEHFAEGEYEEAIAKFEEAYELEPVPNLLFNIGRCYEQLEDWERAEHHYEEFVRSPDIDDDARDQAMDRVRSMRELRDAEDQPDDEELLADVEDDEPEAEDDVESVQEVDEPSMMPGTVATGAGVLMLGAGALTGMAASSNADRIHDTELDYQERSDARSRARTQGIAADALYVGGAAATAVGGYLLFSALRSGSETDAGADASNYTASPYYDGDSAGFGVQFDF